MIYWTFQIKTTLFFCPEQNSARATILPSTMQTLKKDLEVCKMQYNSNKATCDLDMYSVSLPALTSKL